MEAQVVNARPSIASQDETVRCLLAIELSKKSWIVAVNTPLSDKISRYTLKACDWKELLDLCERIRTRGTRFRNLARPARGPQAFAAISAYVQRLRGRFEGTLHC